MDPVDPGLSPEQPSWTRFWWEADDTEVHFKEFETRPLPDDVEKLQALIRSMARGFREQEEAYEQLRHELEKHRKDRFGPSSEKLKTRPDQVKPTEPTPTSASDSSAPTGDSAPAESPKPAPKPKSPGHGRTPISKDLPRDEVVADLPDADKHCDVCGGAVKCIGQLESTQFDYIPAKLRVRVTVRPKYACKDAMCGSAPKVAAMPPQPVDKGKVTAGLLAHLCVSKFLDHIPLYRFRKILLRQGVNLPLSSLVDWCAQVSALLTPLYDLLIQSVISTDYIQTDDTYALVRQPGQKHRIQGHLWVYRTGAGPPYTVFYFTPHRRGEAPQTFLSTFRGYIQADAYKGYDALFKTGDRIGVGCWAHARRGFDESIRTAPTAARRALEQIAEFYRLEKDFAALSPEHRKGARDALTAPLLEKFHTWLMEQSGQVIPKSPLGKAIRYTLNQWNALVRFLEDGRLQIDNNSVERDLRGVALGRKNWMSLGSDTGGVTAAVAYSLVVSAVLNGIEPTAYLTDVLTRIRTIPRERLPELLPDRWKALHQAPAAETILPNSKN